MTLSSTTWFALLSMSKLDAVITIFNVSPLLPAAPSNWLSNWSI